MRQVTLHNGEKLDVIGLGTWTFGGGTHPDYSKDERSLAALRHAFSIGYTHIDTAEYYARGHAEELICQALLPYDRRRFFITTKVMPPNLAYHAVHKALDGSLAHLGTDYIDLYLIHWPSSRTPLSETFRALNEAVAQGKVRHLGVSNFDLAELKEAQELSHTPIVTNQVPYSLQTKTYLRNGVIPYCQQNNILVTAYSPVEEGRLRSYPVLQRIADAQQATPFQVALAWLVQQPQVIAIPMSHNPRHLEENLAAGDLNLTPDEMDQLHALSNG